MSSLAFYDRRGEPITVERFLELLSDVRYRIVVRTRLGDGRELETWWVGMVDELRGITPFASVLRTNGEVTGQWLAHYDSEPAAIAGHGGLCAKLGGRFFCPRCWFASCHPDDLRHGWCARCKEQTAPVWAEAP